jgi:hypothetical protein
MTTDEKPGERLNPFGLALTLIAAVLALVAIFLHRAKPRPFLTLEHNTIATTGGLVAIPLIVVLVLVCVRLYRSGRRSWGPPVLGVVMIVDAALLGSSSALTVKTQLGDRTLSPGIGVYLYGAAGVLALLGGLLLRVRRGGGAGDATA